MKNKIFKINVFLAAFFLVFSTFGLLPQKVSADACNNSVSISVEPDFNVDAGSGFEIDWTIDWGSDEYPGAITVRLIIEDDSGNELSNQSWALDYYSSRTFSDAYNAAPISSSEQYRFYAMIHSDTCTTDLTDNSYVNVGINPPTGGGQCVINTFSADDPTPPDNTATNLNVSVNGNFDWTIALVSGLTNPSPTSGTGNGTSNTGNLTSPHTYRLTCGTANQEVTVDPDDPPPPAVPVPTVDLTYNGMQGPVYVNSGSSGTLSWTVSGAATSCVASNGWSGSKTPTGGSQSIGPLSTSRYYTLTCTNAGGTSADTIEVDVMPVVVAGQPPAAFTIAGGCYGWPSPTADVGLRTSSQGADSYRLERSLNGGAWSTITTNSTNIIHSENAGGAINGTYAWRIIATNPYGSTQSNNLTYTIDAASCGATTGTSYPTPVNVAPPPVDSPSETAVPAAPIIPGNEVCALTVTPSPRVFSPPGPYIELNYAGISPRNADVTISADDLDTGWDGTAHEYQVDCGNNGSFQALQYHTINPYTFTNVCPYSGQIKARTRNLSNQAIAECTITVNPPTAPTVTYQCGSPLADTCSTPIGGTVPLSWTSTNATSCTKDGVAVGTSGTGTSAAITGTVTSTVQCSGPGGTGTDSVTISNTACTGDCAQFISQTVPATVVQGQVFSASVTMKNVGTNTWSGGSAQYRLKSKVAGDPWGATYNIPGSTSVPPGSSYTFNISTIAPTAGTYNFQWGMSKSGTFFAGGNEGTSPLVSVLVYPPPPTLPPGLTANCNAAGTQVTLSWGISTYATDYMLRVDYLANNIGATWYITDPPDKIVNNLVAQSYSMPVIPSQNYSWWVRGNNSGGQGPQATGSFNCPNIFTLTVNSNPTPGGSIQSTDTLINCGTACGPVSYVKDSTVTLEGVPASAYWKFDHWEGDCSGTSSICVLTMDSDKTVTAVFVPRVFDYIEF